MHDNLYSASPSSSSGDALLDFGVDLGRLPTCPLEIISWNTDGFFTALRTSGNRKHIKYETGTDLMRQYYQLPQRSEVELAQRAVELFNSDGQLSFDSDNDYPIAERERWLSSTENALSKIQSCMRRLSKSFVVDEPPSTLP